MSRTGSRSTTARSGASCWGAGLAGRLEERLHVGAEQAVEAVEAEGEAADGDERAGPVDEGGDAGPRFAGDEAVGVDRGPEHSDQGPDAHAAPGEVADGQLHVVGGAVD